MFIKTSRFPNAYLLLLFNNISKNTIIFGLAIRLLAQTVAAVVCK
jgi:hypothetical protein